jgi:hypothetical protein
MALRLVLVEHFKRLRSGRPLPFRQGRSSCSLNAYVLSCSICPVNKYLALIGIAVPIRRAMSSLQVRARRRE